MDGSGFGHATTSAGLDRRPVSLAKRVGNAWYIAYLDGRVTVMRIVRDCTEAIGIACGMLDAGIEVTGIGPMLDTRQQKIDPATLREICRQRRHV